jgi:branched-chain amino acid transport system permease protein
VTELLQHVIDAVSLGSLYALAALGIGLIFGVMRFINFAHGDFITVGAYALIVPSANPVATLFIGDLPWPLVVITICAIVSGVALATEFIVFRPLRDADPTSMMVAAFALSFIIQNSILSIYEARPKSVDLWAGLNLAWKVAGVRVPKLELVTIAATLLLLSSLVIFLRKTSLGIHMRAASEDFKMARLLGVRGNAVITAAFAISGVLAAVVSLLLVAQIGVLNYQMGQPLLQIAFVATVIGGMGSLFGTALGGFTVGVVSVILQIVLPESLRPSRDAFVFGFVILVLLFRPEGIVSVRAIRERV